MGYLALYRKYRPNNFDDVYGQEEVVTVIKNAINCNKVSHAYLFSGPRGTGKTSVAKIIARLVNCKNLVDGSPCEKCYSCLNYLNSNDVVEIDAASNNGVDEIRELKDKINLVPSNSKYKIYIIDEVHMLTTQAFNALLKTLEEPPAHVIFILATTEPHKIPLTISSRCQKFRFSKIDDIMIVDRLKEIVKKEKIKIDDDALFEIARLSDGGMRDAINILDQLVSYSLNKITLDDIYKVNGTVSYDDLYFLLNNIKENNKIEIIKFIDLLSSSGKEINRFIEEFIIFLKDTILYKNTKRLSSIESKNNKIKSIDKMYSDIELYDLAELLNNIETKIKTSTHGTIIFMIDVLKYTDKIKKTEKKDEIPVVDNLKKVDTAEKNDKIISREIICDDNVGNDELKIRINNALSEASKEKLNDIKTKWEKIDKYMYDDSFTVSAGLLKDSLPVVCSSEYIIVSNKLESVVDRINENVNLIEKLLKMVFGYKLLVVALSDKDWNKEKKQYILNVKNGVKYEKIVNEKAKGKAKKSTPSVDELIELVGDKIIEYK